MAVVLEKAVDRLRESIEGGEKRIAIRAPQGSGKTAVLQGLANAYAKSRPVVRIEFPEGDDAALVALVQAATQLGFALPGLLDRVIPAHESARVPWATRLAAVREALASAQSDLLLLLDGPRFPSTSGPEGELFASRAVEITATLLGAHAATVVLAGSWIPEGVAAEPGFRLPLTRASTEDAIARVDGRPLSPVVLQVLQALCATGIDLAGISPSNVRLDHLVNHELARVFLGDEEMCRTMARLAVLRVPFSADLLKRAGLSSLEERRKGILRPLLYEMHDGAYIVPDALARALRAVLPDDVSAAAHRFAADYHRECHDRARQSRDVAAAIRSEMEEIYQLTKAGDAATLLARSLQFVEQYDALGKSLSQKALRASREQGERLRRDAVRAYERAIEHDAEDAYAHHYIAYNLDILASEPERVGREYVIAKDLDRRHSWYHGRHVCFLITTGWVDEARAAWERALLDLDEAEGSRLGRDDYKELHAEVANHLLSRARLSFAREVLEDVPDELRDAPWWRALNQLRVCLEEDRDERLVFPPKLPLEERWEGPHLTTNVGEHLEVKRWRPGRVLGRDEETVEILVAERAPGGEKLSPMSLEAARIEEEWGVPQRMLAAGTFVELLEYEDGSREMKIWDSPSSSFTAIPNLPRLFPRPDRYIRGAFA